MLERERVTGALSVKDYREPERSISSSNNVEEEEDDEEEDDDVGSPLFPEKGNG